MCGVHAAAPSLRCAACSDARAQHLPSARKGHSSGPLLWLEHTACNPGTWGAAALGVTAVCRRMPGHSHPQDKPDASAPSQAEGIPPEGSSNGASSSSGSSSSGGSTSTTTVQAGMGSEKIVGSERADLQIPKVRGSARAVRGGRRAGCAGDPWVPSTPLDAQPIGLPAVHKVLWVSPVCCQLHMTAAPVAQEVVEKLRYQVFGYDTLWVTSVDNYQESGVVFKGNLRTKDPAVAYERMREKLKVRRAARTDTRTLPALERSEEARTSLRRCRRPQRVTQAQGDTLPPGPTPHPHTTQAWGHMHAACLVRVCWVMSGRCSCWRTRTRSPRRWCCRPPRARGSSAGSPRWAQWGRATRQGSQAAGQQSERVAAGVRGPRSPGANLLHPPATALSPCIRSGWRCCLRRWQQSRA